MMFCWVQLDQLILSNKFMIFSGLSHGQFNQKRVSKLLCSLLNAVDPAPRRAPKRAVCAMASVLPLPKVKKARSVRFVSASNGYKLYKEMGP